MAAALSTVASNQLLNYRFESLGTPPNATVRFWPTSAACLVVYSQAGADPFLPVAFLAVVPIVNKVKAWDFTIVHFGNQLKMFFGGFEMLKKRSIGQLLALTAALPGVVVAQSDSDMNKSFLWKQCGEDAILAYVDSESLADLLPDDHSLALADGKARVLIATQDCPTYWFNGEDIGPTREVHHWVAIEGITDVRNIAGAESTLPTMTWFALFTGSSNPASREQWTSSGTMSHEIDSLSLEAPSPEGGGRVSISGELEYSWKISRGQPIEKLVGVNHDVYAMSESGDLVYNRIQCLGNVYGWRSLGSLSVSGGTEPSRVIGTGTYPIAVNTFLPLWCRASLADSPPQ